jgi:tetratricopeptide (TPR) repeat protein
MGLYNQIIKNIASQIQLALSPDESNILNNPPLVNPESYKAYLEGNYQSEKLSARGFQQAKESFQRSIELDSMFAPVYTGMAFAWIGAAQMRIVPLTEAIPKIYEYYQKALVIDDNFSEAQYIKALMSYQGEWDLIKSETAFRKAIEMDPGHVLSHAYYGHLLLIQKRFDEAINEMEIALEADPKNPLILSLYAVVLWHHGDLDQAIELAHQSQEINPNNGLIYTILEGIKYLEGDFHGSMDIMQMKYGDEIDGFDVVVNEYKENGYEQAMLKFAALLQDQAQVNYFNIALYFNRAGRHEEAILWLEKGLENHDPNMPYAFLPAEFNNLRSDPRYSELANKMNLPF